MMRCGTTPRYQKYPPEIYIKYLNEDVQIVYTPFTLGLHIARNGLGPWGLTLNLEITCIVASEHITI